MHSFDTRPGVLPVRPTRGNNPDLFIRVHPCRLFSAEFSDRYPLWNGVFSLRKIYTACFQLDVSNVSLFHESDFPLHIGEWNHEIVVHNEASYR